MNAAQTHEPTDDQRLTAAWPKAPALASRHLAVDQVTVAGASVYISGQVAFDGAAPPRAGKVGEQIGVDEAAGEAYKAAANALHRIVTAFGTLSVVERVLKVTVFVNGAENLTEQPAVADGASRLLVEVLGERGRHSRSAVGVASLPLGVPVEVEVIVRLRDGARPDGPAAAS